VYKVLKLVYIIGTFPSFTTTFIDREIKSLRQRGVDLQVVSIRRPATGMPLSVEQRELQQGVTYLLPVDWLKFIIANLYFVSLRPLVYFRTLFYLLTCPHPDPKARVMTFFPMARSLAPKTDSRDDLEVTQLVKTSDDSWGETNTKLLLSERRVEYNEESDISGPMCMAVAVVLKEKAGDEPPSPIPGREGEAPAEPSTKERRVLVAMGDSDFVTNKYLEQGNPDLFMNAVNWLTEEEELISIRPKDQEQAQVQRLTGRQLRLVTYSSIFAVPLLLLIAGGVVWWKRR